MNVWISKLLAATAFASQMGGAPLLAQEFYQGKTISIVVGYTPGGGYDSNARLLARHLGSHIPGRPNVVVTNMPGGASLTGVMYLDASAPRDGTAMSIFNFGLIGNSRVQPDVIKVDFRKYNWIGSIGEDPPICYVSSRLGVRTLAELQAHGTVHMGRTSGGTAGDIAQKILKKLLHVDIRQVSGYPGNSEAKLAFDRGEIDGNCGPWGEVPAEWIDERKIVPLLNLGSFKPDQLPASVPFAADVVSSSVDKAIIRMLTAGSEISRPFIASGAVPAAQVGILRDAFDATTRDPAFMADARKAGVLVAPRSGQQAQKIVEDIYSAPADVVLAARDLMAD